MDNFDIFKDMITTNAERMFCGNHFPKLFVVDDGHVEDSEFNHPSGIWNEYLSAFPEGTNPIFRVRTVHDGAVDRAFIRRLGLTVGITDDNEIVTLWQNSGPGGYPWPYDVVAEALDKYVRGRIASMDIATPFRVLPHLSTIGQRPNTVLYPDGTQASFTHFMFNVPARYHWREGFVDDTQACYGVTKRSLETISNEALATVHNLINEDQLYRGSEFRGSVEHFIQFKREYDKLATMTEKNTFIWRTSTRFTAIRNTVIGTLLVDISDGMDIEEAVRSFERKVAPMNYKRPTALVSQKMIDDAKSTVADLGLTNDLQRRHATVGDMDMRYVRAFSADNVVEAVPGDVWEGIKPTARGEKARTVSGTADTFHISEFMEYVANKGPVSVDVQVEHRHMGRFMTLTAPVAERSSLLKWPNGIGWSYDGDVADSITQRVKNAGGRIDTNFRISLGWFNTDDLDLHLRYRGLVGAAHIYYGLKRMPQHFRLPELDVDMNVFNPVRNAVENIFFDGMPVDGEYEITVNQFTTRTTTDVGFEVEFQLGPNMAVGTLSYNRKVKGTIPVLKFTIASGRVTQLTFGVDMRLSSRSTEKWGVTVGGEVWTPVTMVVSSPNWWGYDEGPLHHFFILKNCLNPNPVRGFYNEQLRPDLVAKHSRVFELLGSRLKIEPCANQLTGIGFTANASMSPSINARVNKRPFRVVF